MTPIHPSPPMPPFLARVLPALAGLALLAGCAEVQDPPGDSADPPPTAEVASFEGTYLDEAKEEGRAELVYLYVPSSGFAYRDGEGELTGVTVELLRDLAAFVEREHQVEVEIDWIEEPEWATFYGMVRESRGGVFGIGNVTITEARRDELRFSPPYLNNVAVLVTHENVSELSSMDEIGEAFQGLTGLPYPGTLHEERLLAIRDEHLPEMPTREVSSNDELVSLLASGDGYFGYIDVYNYWRARSAGHALRRHEVGDDASEQFGVIMPLDSDWGPVVDAFFAEDGGYPSSDRYRSLLEEHLGSELAGLLADG